MGPHSLVWSKTVSQEHDGPIKQCYDAGFAIERYSGTVEERKYFDEIQIQEIIQEIGWSGVATSDCRRTGKGKDDGSRLLKIKSGRFSKEYILSKSKCLRNSRLNNTVYIQTDRTPMKQEKERLLRKELMQRRHNCETH